MITATPLGRVLEDTVALTTMFRLRGPVPPPETVAVIALDRDSGRRLGLPRQVRDWPRTLHAGVIERLNEAGARAIAFDLVFEKARADDPAEDVALAQAIARSGRVVLLEMLDRSSRRVDFAGGSGVVTTDRTIRPQPMFAEAAVGLAPFPLPKAQERVTHFWAFVPAIRPQPTLPAMTLAAYASDAHDTLERMVAGTPGSIEVGRGSLDARSAALRERFLEAPTLAAQLERDLASRETSTSGRMRALLRLYGGADARTLNFYGPSAHILTVPVADLFQPDLFAALKPDLEGRAVFVGLSEPFGTHEDDFKTAFSRPDGVDLGGVEIGATAFANMLAGNTLDTPGIGLGLLLLIGFAVALAFPAVLLPVRWAIPTVLVVALAYALLAAWAFTSVWLRLPLGVPLLVQLPLGLFGGLWLQYRASRRTAVNLASGIAHYLPANVAASLAETPLTAVGQADLVHAISMVCDAEGFTHMAEGMAPVALKRLLDQYFQQMFEAIRGQDGLITDIVGDGVTAVWVAPEDDAQARQRACRAALLIDAIRIRGGRDHARALTTRIGLNPGQVVLGNVGGSGRFAYSVVGDAVNTASRVERLNKHLGTRVLAAEALVSGLEGQPYRSLGAFRLFGKDEAISIVELLDLPPDQPEAPWRRHFAEGLEALQQQHLKNAENAFRAVLDEQPDDGPSRFFLQVCDPRLPRSLRASVDQLGAIHLYEK